MTETTVIDDTSLRIERTYEASAEELFDAWTNPEVLRRWWRPTAGMVTPVAEVDLRVGGRYRISMEDPENGAEHTAGGEYSEVDRPRRLVYSWQWQQDGAPDHVSTVTVEFQADGDRTKVVIEHTGLPSSESRDQHGQGWTGILAMLQAHLSEKAPQTS